MRVNVGIVGKCQIYENARSVYIREPKEGVQSVTIAQSDGVRVDIRIPVSVYGGVEITDENGTVAQKSA